MFFFFDLNKTRFREFMINSENNCELMFLLLLFIFSDENFQDLDNGVGFN